MKIKNFWGRFFFFTQKSLLQNEKGKDLLLFNDSNEKINITRKEPARPGIYGAKLIKHLPILGECSINDFVIMKPFEHKSGVPGLHSMMESVKKRDNLDAGILDYLLENQELIPDSWKDFSFPKIMEWESNEDSPEIYFWGSEYADFDSGVPFARGMSFDKKKGKWFGITSPLFPLIGSQSFAAILVKK